MHLEQPIGPRSNSCSMDGWISHWALMIDVLIMLAAQIARLMGRECWLVMGENSGPFLPWSLAVNEQTDILGLCYGYRHPQRDSSALGTPTKVELLGLRLESPVSIFTFVVWSSSALPLLNGCSAPSYIQDSRTCPDTQGDRHINQDLQRQDSFKFHGGSLFLLKAQTHDSGRR